MVRAFIAVILSLACGTLPGRAAGAPARAFVQPAADAPATPPPAVGGLAPGLEAVWAGGETRRYRFTQSVSEKTGSAATPEQFVERRGTMRLEVSITAFTTSPTPPTTPEDVNPEVGTLAPGETAWRMTIDVLRLTAALPSGGEVVFDSADPELCKPDNRFAVSAGPLVGASVVFITDMTGKVTRATGHDDLLDITSPAARLAVQMIESTSIGAKFGPVMGWPQSGSQAVGTEWQHDRSVPYVPGIVLEVANACRVEAADGAIVTVASKGTPRLRIPNPARLGTREIAASDIHSTTQWDAAKGALRKHEAFLSTDVLLKGANAGEESVGLVRNKVESVLEAIE